ncbi:MAG: hypothetical protein ACOCVF_00405 [bacterium]
MRDQKIKDYEPKTMSRFVVKFPNQFNIFDWTITKINKPKFTNGKWEDMKIVFVDPIGLSTSKGLYNIIDFLKKDVNDNKSLFNIKIKLLDPTGIEIEEWVIYVEEVLTINFGELDYSNDNIQEPYLILKPLNCVLN